MMKSKALPIWAQWASGGALLLIALTAGATGLVLNVAHGLDAGPAAGLTFGLADLAKVVIPICAGVVGWSKQMRITAAICVAVSLWSAVNVYFDAAGGDLLAKQHGATVYAERAKRIVELEKSVADLDAYAAAEARKGGCGPNCRALTAQAAEARRRLDAARNERAEAKPVELSDLAAAIAIATGRGAEGIAWGIGAVKALLFLALLEGLVWLSVPAMQLLGEATKLGKGKLGEVPAEIVIEVVEFEPTSAIDPAPAEPIRLVRAGTAAYYRARIERDRPDLAARIASGELSVYRASIQAGMRKAPAKDWAKPEAYGVAAHENV